jgi:DNA replication and repair protein RecF
VALVRISIHDFRNIAEAVDVSLDPQLTLVSGANAQGKTNFLEAVALLLAGLAIRGHSEREMVRQGCSVYRLSGTWQDRGDEEPVTLVRAVSVDPARRQCQGPQFPVVVFSPDDLYLVKGGPENRRRFLDDLAVQLYPRYLRELRLYQRALAQRNRALKDRAAPGVLASFENALAESGSYLWSKRLELLTALRPAAEQALRGLAETESLSVELVLGGHAERPDADSFRRELARRLPEEMERGMTLTGPHRDEVKLSVNHRSAERYASQGQQRSVALALKLAARHLLQERWDRPPVVLLDDVLSELDGRRREALIALMSAADQQTIVTDTAADAYRPLAPWHLVVRDGTIRMAGA